MPLISKVITDLIEIQEIIGDQNIILATAEKADIPFPEAKGLGIDILDPDPPEGPKRNGQVKR